MTEQKKRILIAMPLPPPYSGPEIMSSKLLGLELNQFFDVCFLDTSLRRKPSDRGKLDLEGIIRSARVCLFLFKKILSFNPTVVYLRLTQNKSGFLRDFSYICICKLLRKRFFLLFEDGSFDKFFFGQNYFFRLLIRRTIAQADFVVVLSPSLKNQFKHIYPHTKIKVIPNATPLVGLQIRRKNKNEQRVLFLSTISFAKGAIDLLKAAPLVLEKNRLVRFDFVGNIVESETNIMHIKNPKNNRNEIKRIVRENSLQHTVFFHGELLGNKKAKLFENSSVFVLPSYSEGLPNVILEAMSFGLPIVTTPVGGIPDFFVDGKNGFFVQPGSVAQIAEKVSFLLNNPKEREKIGKENIKIAKRLFSMERWKKDLVELFSNA